MRLEKLLTACKNAIENAAYSSYYEVDRYDFKGCSCVMPIDNKDEIIISCDEQGNHEVEIYKSDGIELPNIEKAITLYLDKHANEYEEWKDACDNDMWRDVDPGCDPAFPRRGDFERWAYA